jgi:hypothetical protein
LINEISAAQSKQTNKDINLKNLTERFNLQSQHKFIQDILKAAQSLKLSLGKTN